jgi:hypothetical protein
LSSCCLFIFSDLVRIVSRKRKKVKFTKVDVRHSNFLQLSVFVFHRPV